MPVEGHVAGQCGGGGWPLICRIDALIYAIDR